MNKLLIILLFLVLNIINCDRVRIYERVEKLCGGKGFQFFE